MPERTRPERAQVRPEQGQELAGVQVEMEPLRMELAPLQVEVEMEPLQTELVPLQTEVEMELPRELGWQGWVKLGPRRNGVDHLDHPHLRRHPCYQKKVLELHLG